MARTPVYFLHARARRCPFCSRMQKLYIYYTVSTANTEKYPPAGTEKENSLGSYR